MSGYINQREVDAAAWELAAIDPKLKIEGVSSRNNRAIAVYVTLMEKGNKSLIDKLLAAGWVKSNRKKVAVEPGYGLVRSTQYDGYSFALTLKKSLRLGGDVWQL